MRVIGTVYDLGAVARFASVCSQNARYIINKKRQIDFEVGAYDAKRPLIIDPVLDYSTYLGGSSFDDGRDIVIDASGNAYITGRTASFNFPVTIPSFDTTYANSFNVTTTIGVYDPSDRTFYLRNSNTVGPADITFQYGPAGATPLAGNWDRM